MYSASQLVLGRQDLEQGSIMLQNLVNLAESGGVLSIAEEEYACSFLAVAHTDGDGSFLDLHELPFCKNYSFTGCYLSYENNLDGHLVARNAFGPIAPNIVVKDVAFLEEQYQDWSRVIQITNHPDALLQHVAKESRNHLKNSDRFARSTMMGSRLRQQLRKSVTLHSKYLFLKIKEFYQELGDTEQVLSTCGIEIVVDSFAYFHVLFRHYAPRATRYQNDASYHTDQSITPEDLPNHLLSFLAEYFTYIPCSQFNKRRTYIRYNGKIYAIWFKDAERHVAGTRQPILRLQTFYPVTIPRELAFVDNLAELTAPSGMGLFYTPTP